MVSFEEFHEWLASNLPEALQESVQKASGATNVAFPDLICRYKPNSGLVEMKLYGKEHIMGLKIKENAYYFTEGIASCTDFNPDRKKFSEERVNSSLYICDREIKQKKDIVRIECKLKSEPKLDRRLLVDLVDMIIREAIRIAG